MKEFQKEKIISTELYRRITDIRVDKPERIMEAAQKRRRRTRLAPSGRLNIVAADHPARGSLAVGDNDFAMGDRHDLLARLVYVLQTELMDGVLGSMDLLEELILLHALMSEKGPGFLDEKVMIASLNRGGHPGVVWELNDPITGTDAKTCKEMNLDAAKMLLRIDPDSSDSLKTLMACVQGVKDMSNNKLSIFLEPLPVKNENGRHKVINDADLLSGLVSITAALGNTSRYTWLKLPFTKNFEKVLQATTLPVVILGGGKSPDITSVLSDLDTALRSGHQVRGAMFGRNLLYPDSVDALKLAVAIGKLVHSNEDLNGVLKELGTEM